MDLEKLENIMNQNIYNEEQIEMIKYAMAHPSLNEDLILNPSIPAKYMEMYNNLSARKVDIKPYIDAKWHESGYPANILYHLIIQHSKGYDVNGYLYDIKEEDLIEKLNEQVDLKELEKLYSETELSTESINKITKFNIQIQKYFLNLSKSFVIDRFINKLTPLNFNLEQIKYLYTVYSTGYDISNIMNPELSVEDMKEIVINGEKSENFLNYVNEDYNSRKKQ